MGRTRGKRGRGDLAPIRTTDLPRSISLLSCPTALPSHDGACGAGPRSPVCALTCAPLRSQSVTLHTSLGDVKVELHCDRVRLACFVRAAAPFPGGRAGRG